MFRLPSLLVVLTLLGGCSATTPIPRATTSGSPILTPSPTGSRTTKPVARARSVVFVTESGLSRYDVQTDTVYEIARAPGIRLPKWAGTNAVSFVQDQGDASILRLLDFSRRDVRDLFVVPTGIRAYGWSPSLDTVAYVTVGPDAYPEVHYRALAGDAALKTVATLARALGRGATITDQERVEWSSDGSHILVVFTPADGDPRDEGTPEQSQLQVRTADGSLAWWVGHSRDPTMGFWNPDGKKLFYRTTSGGRVWRPGDTESRAVRGGGRWLNPWPSPDGSFVAFDSGASGAGVTVRVLDLETGKARAVTKTGFFHPVVSDLRTVWVQRVIRCERDCPSPVSPAPEVFAVDLRSGKLRKLALPTLVGADVLYR